jgi:hypothetical protein
MPALLHTCSAYALVRATQSAERHVILPASVKLCCEQLLTTSLYCCAVICMWCGAANVQRKGFGYVDFVKEAGAKEAVENQARLRLVHKTQFN